MLKLSNPLAENAFDLEGLDSCQFTMPPPPDCASAAEGVEAAANRPISNKIPA